MSLTLAQKPKATEGKAASPVASAARRPAPAAASLQRRFGNRAVLLDIQRQAAGEAEVEPPDPSFAATPLLSGSGSAAPPADDDASVQRKCACGGSCSSCRTEAEETGVQTKLEIDQPGDMWEVEADAIADAAVGSPSPRQSPVTPHAKRSAPRPVAAPGRKLASRARGPPAPARQTDPSDGLEHRILSRRGSGVPLPPHTRAFMEDRLQADLSAVRIHTDGAADSLNGDLHSYAFTSENNVFFAAGQYRPGTTEGERLLAHELVHTIQQGAAKPRIQRAPKIPGLGDWAHDEIQDRLRAQDSSLITEAPIPGGTTKVIGQPEFDPGAMGFADLYKSSGNVISGIRGKKEGVVGDQGSETISYANINPGNKVHMLNHSPQPLASLTSSPRISKTGTWSELPGFPGTFQVGEIKPLFLDPIQFARNFEEGFGLGFAQVQTYKTGFEQFVTRVHQDSGGVTRPSTTGSYLDLTGKIPASIDYRQFAAQSAAPTDAVTKGSKDGTQRLWVYQPEAGILVYFLLPHPFAAPGYVKRADDLLNSLKPLLERVHGRKKTLSGTLPVGTKRKPGVPVQRKKRTETPAIADTKAQEDWTAWEADRRAWDTGTPTAKGAEQFIEGDALGPLLKTKIDSKLGRETPTGQDERKKLKKLNLWSGLSGKVLGWLGFKFGWAFAKIEAVFNKLGERFSKFRKKATELAKVGEGATIDWKKAAFKVVKEILVEFLKQMVASAFSIFANCINGIISKAADALIEEAREDLAEYLEPVHDQFTKFQEEFSGKYEPMIAAYEQALEILETIDKVKNLLSWIEVSLRLLIQALSCGSPPALGCLWGLVAQVGFSTAAAIAIGTDAFRMYIARPAARSLVDAVVGDTIRSFLTDLFTSAGLGEFVAGVGACAPTSALAGDRADTSREPYFLNDAPGMGQLRAEMESKYGAQMMADLQQALRSNGQPATKAQIEALLKSIQDSGKSPAQIAKILESARAGAGQPVEISGLSAQFPKSKEGGKGDGGKGEATTPVADVSGNKIFQGGKAGQPSGVSFYVRAKLAHKDGKPAKVEGYAFRGDKHIGTFENIDVVFLSEREGQNKDGTTQPIYRYRVTVQRYLDPILPGSYLPEELTGLLSKEERSVPASRKSAIQRSACSTCAARDDDLQPKLELDTPGDRWETEADSIAEAVTGGGSTAPAAAPAPGPTFASRSRAPPSSSGPATGGHVERTLLSRRGQGAPLPAPTRAFMERGLRSDLGSVRIHTGAEADSLNAQLHSYAFTSHNDIYFARGQYRPGTPAGDRLLAHELVHTVQQGASRPAVQRKKVPRVGEWEHDQIQERLRAADGALITEAPIPGAAPSKKEGDILYGRPETDMGRMGFADLYKSTGNVIAGVRGKWDGGALKYENINPRNGRQMVGHKPQPLSLLKTSPRHSGGVWSELPGFPEKFWIGEIKPLFLDSGQQHRNLMLQSLGLIQVETLRQGFREFVERVHQDSSKKTRPTTGSDVLDLSNRIPLSIDYSRFDTAVGSDAGAITKKSKQGPVRVWVHQLTPGLLVYFELAHPYPAFAHVHRADLLLEDFEALHKQIARRPAPIPGALPVQRKRTDTPDIADTATQTSWKSWEAGRAQWDKGNPKDPKAPPGAAKFLKEDAFWPGVKLGIDSALKLPAAKAPEAKKLKKIERWSGTSGKVLGWLRFKFAWVFDKLHGVFGSLGKRLSSFREKATSLMSSPSGGGWKAAAFGVIKKIIAQLLKDFVATAFETFAKCVTGVIGKAVDAFFEDVREEIHDFLEAVHDKLDKFHEIFATRYESVISTLESVLKVIHTIEEVISTFKWIERGMRALIQAISCATPPGFGCLWGLIGQLAFDKIAEKAVTSDLFESRLGRPAAKRIMEATVGSHIRGFLHKFFTEVNMGDFVNGVPMCALNEGLPGTGNNLSRDASFSNNEPGVKDLRDQVEKQYGREMVEDLRKIFGKGGKPASPEALQKLIEAIRKADKPVEDLAKILNRNRKGDGTIDPKAIEIQLEQPTELPPPGGAAPPPPGKPASPAKVAGRPPAGTKPATKTTAPGGIPVIDLSTTEKVDTAGSASVSDVAIFVEVPASPEAKGTLSLRADAFRNGRRVARLENLQAAFSRKFEGRNEKGAFVQYIYTVTDKRTLGDAVPGVALGSEVVTYAVPKDGKSATPAKADDEEE